MERVKDRRNGIWVQIYQIWTGVEMRAVSVINCWMENKEEYMTTRDWYRCGWMGVKAVKGEGVINDTL